MKTALAVSLVVSAWIVGSHVERRAKAEVPVLETASFDEPTRMTVAVVPPLVVEEPRGEAIPASGTCVRPTVHDQNELHRRIAGWVDRTYAKETSDATEVLDLHYGCVEGGKIFVVANADRSIGGNPEIGRWWVLRVTDSAIEKIAERSGPAMNDWMEWVQEQSIGPIGLVDLDGDGTHDLVYAAEDHEGGAMHSNYEFWGAMAKRTKRIASKWAALEDVELEPRRVVLVLRGDEAEGKRYCLGASKMLPCAR